MMKTDKQTKIYDEIYKELMVNYQSLEETIKQKKEEKNVLKLKNELYNKCLDDHLLEKGSKFIKEHLEENKQKVKDIDREVDELLIKKDAFRIELEVFQKEFRD